MIVHAAIIARTQIHWEGGFLLVVLLALLNTLGRILGGAVSDKIGRINTLRIIFAMQAINMLLFNFDDSIALLALGAAVFDAFGSYGIAYLIACLLLAISLVITFTFCT